MIRALWIPGWYELDPHLEVGFDDEFAFWRVVSDNLSAISSWVFYNTIWEQGQGIFATGKITAIRHPELGEIRKIDTRGLDYTITLADGVELLVNAEEEPGKTYERQLGSLRLFLSRCPSQPPNARADEQSGKPIRRKRMRPISLAAYEAAHPN
jgi:hypothetical protein